MSSYPIIYIYIFTLFYYIMSYYCIMLLYYYIIISIIILYYVSILYIIYNIYTLIPIENHTFSWYRRRFFSVSPHCHVEKFTCWQPVRRSGRENGMILEVDTPFLSTEELGGNSRSIMIYPVFFLWSKMINIFSKIFPDTLEPIMSWFDFRQNVGMRSAGCASAGGLARNAAPRHLAIQNTSVDLFLW